MLAVKMRAATSRKAPAYLPIRQIGFMLYVTSMNDVLNLADVTNLSRRARRNKILYRSNLSTLKSLDANFRSNLQSERGIAELYDIFNVCRAVGFGYDRIRIDPSIVRGLEYYTGPVFEVDLTFPITGDDGKPVRFGSVAAGGRYDGLVSRFRGEPVPATGFSIGVSRLAAALQHLGKLDSKPEPGPVVVTVFDKDRLADYQNMVAEAARRRKSAPSFISAIRATSAISSNTPTSATRLASSSRAPTKRPKARSRSRT